MSQENVEVARSFRDAFNRRDVGALLELMHPKVEFVPILAKLEGVVYRGPEEVGRWIAEVDRDWVEFKTEPQEFRDLNDAVLTLGTWNARARASGVRLDSQPGAWLTHMREGTIVRHETFTSRAQALEAAGVSE
jgi:ketosteroid isomerase-like protein